MPSPPSNITRECPPPRRARPPWLCALVTPSAAYSSVLCAGAALAQWEGARDSDANIEKFACALADAICAFVDQYYTDPPLKSDS